MTVFQKIASALQTGPISNAEGGSRIFMVFGIWVYLGFLPDGDLVLTAKWPTPRGNIIVWADYQYEKALRGWAKKRSVAELDILAEDIQNTIKNLATVAMDLNWSFTRQSSYKKELVKNLAVIKQEKNRRMSMQTIQLA